MEGARTGWAGVLWEARRWHDVGSLHQVSCDQAGGRAACLLMLGLGPGQCKHSPRPFPPPAESPSPACGGRTAGSQDGAPRAAGHLLP